MSGKITEFKALTKRILTTVTNHKIQAMPRKKLIDEIENKKRCSCCLIKTVRFRNKRKPKPLRPYNLNTTTHLGRHVAAMSLDALGMFPYENETRRSNRFRRNGEFCVCKPCYDTFYAVFRDTNFTPETSYLFEFLAPVGEEHQRKPPSPPGFQFIFFHYFYTLV